MTGFGKTTQATTFAAQQFKEWSRFSAAEDGFLQAVAQWLAARKKQRNKTLLILDDLQWVVDPAARQTLFNLLLQSLQLCGVLKNDSAAYTAWLDKSAPNEHAELGISLGTVKFRVKNIMQKFGAENRTVAVKVAQEEGLL